MFFKDLCTVTLHKRAQDYCTAALCRITGLKYLNKVPCQDFQVTFQVCIYLTGIAA